MLTSQSSKWMLAAVSMFALTLSTRTMAEGNLSSLVTSKASHDIMGGEPFHKWLISVGVFMPNEGRGYHSDDGFSLSIARAFCHSTENLEFLLGFRFSRYSSQTTGYTPPGDGGTGGERPYDRSGRYFSSGSKVDVDVYNPFVQLRHFVGDQHRFYLSSEIGGVVARGGGKESNDAAFGLGAGLQLSRFFIDARYLFSTGHSPSAVVVSGGVRF